MPSSHSLSHAFTIACISALLASCGGGGGGGSGNSSPQGGSSSGPAFSISQGSVNFTATSPFAAAPAGATLVGTVSGAGTLSGTLYIVIAGPVGTSFASSPIDSISSVTISGNSGHATITPKAPDMVGVGTASATLSVHACLNDPTCATGELSGSPQTVSVTYTVGGVTPPDSVMPHVAVAGVAGDVVIRGTHLTGTSDVKFGTTEATNITVVSDTEVHASYPPLTEGTYTLSLNSGAVAFTGSMVARSSVNYPTETVPLPETPAQVSFLRYDADRRALLVGGQYYKSQTTTLNKLWRYTYTGASSAPAWGTPSSTPIDGIVDLQLSPDGSALFAVANAGVLELSPDGLSTSQTTSVPASLIPNHIAIANDSMAIITTAASGTISSVPLTYYYNINTGTFFPVVIPFGQLELTEVTGAADGSHLFAQVTGITPSQQIVDYAASTSKRTYTALSGGIGGIASSSNASRIVVSSSTSAAPARVYAGDYGITANGATQPLGTIPLYMPPNTSDLSQDFVAIIVNPQGTRAYVLRLNGTLHSYALDQPTTSTGDYPEVGTGISVVIPNNASANQVRTAITPDGSTLFFAGNQGVLVVPALP